MSVIGEMICDDGLDCIAPYVYWAKGDDVVTLDGKFLAEELVAIAQHMRGDDMDRHAADIKRQSAPTGDEQHSEKAPAANTAGLPAFTPTEQQYQEWCERHGLPYHLSRDAFDDATSLYLTATSGSELADVRALFENAMRAEHGDGLTMEDLDALWSELPGYTWRRARAQQAVAPATQDEREVDEDGAAMSQSKTQEDA